MRLLLALVLGASLAACYAQASAQQLARRASFDLQCPENEIQVVEIDESTKGAMGCGRRATYVERCDGPRQHSMTECTWVLNSPTGP